MITVIKAHNAGANCSTTASANGHERRSDAYIKPVEKIKEIPSFRLIDICKRQTLAKGRIRMTRSEMTLKPAVYTILLVPMQVPGISRFQSLARGEHCMMLRKNSML